MCPLTWIVSGQEVEKIVKCKSKCCLSSRPSLTAQGTHLNCPIPYSFSSHTPDFTSEYASDMPPSCVLPGTAYLDSASGLSWIPWLWLGSDLKPRCELQGLEYPHSERLTPRSRFLALTFFGQSDSSLQTFFIVCSWSCYSSPGSGLFLTTCCL